MSALGCFLRSFGSKRGSPGGGGAAFGSSWAQGTVLNHRAELGARVPCAQVSASWEGVCEV